MPRPAEAKLVRGNFLRITDMRSRPANISVAASRTTVRRRIVETSEPAHRHRAAKGRSQEALTGFLIHGGSAHTGALKGRCEPPLRSGSRSACGRP